MIDWKSYTRKKAREFHKSGCKTGGGDSESKPLNPAEEKLMSALTWVTVKGVEVLELGLEDCGEEPEQKAAVDINCSSTYTNAPILEAAQLSTTTSVNAIVEPYLEGPSKPKRKLELDPVNTENKKPRMKGTLKLLK